MGKEYTYVTTYIVLAPDEATANEVKEKVESVLHPGTLHCIVVEHWTKLTDVEDATRDS